MNSSSGPEVTSSQRTALDKLRSNLQDILQPQHDDYYLIKWLRVKNWDIASAEKLFRDNEEWRRVNDIDSVLSTYTPPEVLQNYVPGGYSGVTKDGYPIWIDPMGRGDQRGFYHSVSTKEMVLHKIWKNEEFFRVRCPEVSKKFGRKIDQCVQIVDIEGFGLKNLWKPAIDMISALITMAEEHYPDTYRSIIGINAPSMIPLAYSIFKPFLSANTRTKIKIYGSNYKEHLLREIDADQLPAHWGGTATDPDGDPFCRSKICIGGTIPEKYYRKKILEENNDLSKFTTATVQKGSTLQLDFPVKVKNSLLSWNFYTDDNDIGFGVFRRTNPDQRQKAGEMEAVVASERVNSHVIPEAGRVQCENPGTYVVRFDNTYSWVRAKKLYFDVVVVEPDTSYETPL